MSSANELAEATAKGVQNITYTQIKAAIVSLENDHAFRNDLVKETRGMKLEDVGSVFMIVIFRYIQAEVIGEGK